MKKTIFVIFFFAFALWVAMPLIDNGPPMATETTTINDVMVFAAPLPPSLLTMAFAVVHYAVVDTTITGIFGNLRDRDRRCDTNKQKLVKVNSARPTHMLTALIYKV